MQDNQLTADSLVYRRWQLLPAILVEVHYKLRPNQTLSETDQGRWRLEFCTSSGKILEILFMLLIFFKNGLTQLSDHQQITHHLIDSILLPC